MTEMNIEVTDVTVTHDVVEVETDTLQVSSTVPTSITIASAGAAGPAGPSGGAGPTGGEGPAGPATPVDYQGTGFPEGVVTATVGKTYRDNSATNGAILWIKASGGGNTGWKVVYGDTGWRAIQDNELNYGFTGYIANNAYRLNVRRINNEVHVAGAFGNLRTAINNAAAEGVTQTVYLWNSPTGFKPGTGPWRYFRGWGYGGATNVNHTMFIYDATGLNLRYADQVATSLTGGYFESVVFPTTDPWPTTLPGTPA